jgi:hypothetical protein
MAAGKAFRIRRQNNEGEHLGVPKTNACRACYRPMPTTKDAYCSERCQDAHTRLRGHAA